MKKRKIKPINSIRSHYNKGTKSEKFKSIINYNIYTNKVKSLDGKRPDKRTCMFYEKSNQHCNNKDCNVTICTTASNCTCFKRREKVKKKLSGYNDNYIHLPVKASVHEKDNRYISASKNIGTPCHVGYLKSDGQRRHKARCVYYDKIKKYLNYYYINAQDHHAVTLIKRNDIVL